jgi:hypothetical protein
MRRFAVLVTLVAAVALAVPASAQTEPPRLAVTATSDRCDGGLPVVDYTVTNRWSTAASVGTWWVADASVFGVAGTHNLGPAPDGERGSFKLPFAFYASVTVFATVVWPDGEVTTNASWADHHGRRGQRERQRQREWQRQRTAADDGRGRLGFVAVAVRVLEAVRRLTRGASLGTSR